MLSTPLLRFCVLLLCTCVPALVYCQEPSPAPTEAQYIEALARHFSGQQEVKVPGGRVDILTNEYAIEVERAPKWKNSIGQAIWYGLQTNKKPGIVLLVTSSTQRKYAIQLGSALEYAGLGQRVKLWLWPDDFPAVSPSPKAAEQRLPAQGQGEYWLNLNGNKRHRSTCTWYGNTSRGRYCTEDEGTPAGCCH